MLTASLFRDHSSLDVHSRPIGGVKRTAELAVSVTSCPPPFQRSIFVEFWPKYTMVNRSTTTVYFRQVRGSL